MLSGSCKYLVRYCTAPSWNQTLTPSLRGGRHHPPMTTANPEAREAFYDLSWITQPSGRWDCKLWRSDTTDNQGFQLMEALCSTQLPKSPWGSTSCQLTGKERKRGGWRRKGRLVLNRMFQTFKPAKMAAEQRGSAVIEHAKSPTFNRHSIGVW